MGRLPYLVGFDSFVIYHNGSDDRTGDVLDRLRRVHDIKVIEWPRASKYAQFEAYDDCLKNFRDSFDWIAFIGSDEFVAPVHDGSVKPMLARLDCIDGVYLNWSIFGSSGHDAAPPELIVENFTYRAPSDHAINGNVKMLIRAAAAVRVLDPHSIAIEGHAVHANGAPCPRRADGRTESMAGFATCRVNHYFTRSRQHLRAKMRRGYREGHRSENVFATHDLNDVEDRWAATLAPSIRTTLARLDLLPLRAEIARGPVASSEEEKDSAGWVAHRPTVSDVLGQMPAYVLEEGNTLFDPELY